MQFAFSNHARNDWSLEWQCVNKQKLVTGLCFSWTACSWQPSIQETGNQKRTRVVLIVDALTWFLVCCCALSLLLGCRGVSLGMGPIGVGYGKRKGHSETNTLLQIKNTDSTIFDSLFTFYIFVWWVAMDIVSWMAGVNITHYIKRFNIYLVWIVVSDVSFPVTNNNSFHKSKIKSLQR